MALARHDSPECEWTERRDPATGRRIRQWTVGEGNDYHLYYQAYPLTPDGRWLVFYREQDGRTDLFRLDRRDGAIARLTRGRSQNAGWWPWVPMAAEGVFGFISCLNPVGSEVFYHDLDEVRAVNVETQADRLVCTGPPGTRPLSQLACSPDGRWVATVWCPQAEADRAECSHQEARAAGRPLREAEHYWRRTIHSRLDVIDTSSGEVRTLADLRAPFHNTSFAADSRHPLAVTPPGTEGGLFVADVARPGWWRRWLLPAELGNWCHYHATSAGTVLFDSNVAEGDDPLVDSFLGSIRMDGTGLQAWSVGPGRYCHIGNDPAGEFLFASVDNGGTGVGHHIAAARPGEGGRADLLRLTGDLRPGRDQFCHAHPVLVPDGSAIVYTALDDRGTCSVFEVDVSDLGVRSSEP